MLQRRAMVERRLDSEEIRHAQAITHEAERAQARDGRIISEADRAAWREQRRRDIDQELPAEHPRSLRAAGIDPRDYRAAAEEQRRAMRRRSTAAIDRDRDLLRGIPREDRRQPLPADTRAAAKRIPPEELRRRKPEERAAGRHEHRVRRRRAHLHRR
jgi:hypothetical protein